MVIYCITSNLGKFKEMQAIIPALKQLPLDLPEIQEIDPKKVITAKIKEALKYVQGPVLVEDTSLFLEPLNGLPGPFIKWFLKALGNEGLWHLAAAFHNFNAEAKTLIGYATADGTISFFEGSCKGTIVKPKGSQGFGWDALFQPEGYEKTFAELSLEEKNTLSMRRKALEQLKIFLEKEEKKNQEDPPKSF